MKITITQIYNFKPCQAGIERLNKQLRGFPQDKPFDILDLIGGENTRADIYWLLDKMGHRKKICEDNAYFASLPAGSYDEEELVAKLREMVAAIP